MEFYYHDTDGDILILSSDGGLNSSTSEQFIHTIEELLDSGLRKIIIDCTQLTYISSFGLSVLLRIHNRMKKHKGDVKICCVKGVIMHMLQLVRLDKHFDIYADVEQARRAFAVQPG